MNDRREAENKTEGKGEEGEGNEGNWTDGGPGGGNGPEGWGARAAVTFLFPK